MPDDSQKFFSALESERQERRQDIAGINDRIDQILDAVNKMVAKPDRINIYLISIFITIIVALGTLMGVQITNVNESSRERHTQAISLIVSMDQKNTVDLNMLHKENKILLEWRHMHEAEVSKINAAQNETLRWLEKQWKK